MRAAADLSALSGGDAIARRYGLSSAAETKTVRMPTEQHGKRVAARLKLQLEAVTSHETDECRLAFFIRIRALLLDLASDAPRIKTKTQCKFLLGSSFEFIGPG